jgi:hypothetical protein
VSSFPTQSPSSQYPGATAGPRTASKLAPAWGGAHKWLVLAPPSKLWFQPCTFVLLPTPSAERCGRDRGARVQSSAPAPQLAPVLPQPSHSQQEFREGVTTLLRVLELTEGVAGAAAAGAPRRSSHYTRVLLALAAANGDVAAAKAALLADLPKRKPATAAAETGALPADEATGVGREPMGTPPSHSDPLPALPAASGDGNRSS